MPFVFSMGNGELVMGENKRLWKYVCEQAFNERDPNRLVEMAIAIDALLETEQQDLGRGNCSVGRRDGML
jgi:hypothetical protein